MRGLRRWAGYAALNRPLTILGVERRGFLLSATLGLAMWNATASLVTGGVVFAYELPYWGWLEDGRTCLTRSGELIAAGRLAARGGGWAFARADRPRAGPLAAVALGSRHRYAPLLLYAPSAGLARGRGRRRLRHRSGVPAEAPRVPLQLRAAARGLPGLVARSPSTHGGRRAQNRKRLPAHAVVEAGRALVEEHTPIEMLEPAEASRLLSELINRPGMIWDGATGSGMNWWLALSELEAERSHLRLDGEPVILYSLLSPPGQAYANLLQELYCLDAAMVDSAAATESDRLGEALVELEADGVSYGEASLTVALHGELGRIGRLDGDLRRLFAAHAAKVIREGYGQLPAWFSRLPAQPRGRQVRKVFVSAGVAACLAPLFGPPRGTVKSKHLGHEALAVLETPWRTAYHYDLFAGDVGHTLMLGATGSGKSFTLNFLLVEALRCDPRVLILDFGGSYRWLTRFLGGRYLELSPGEAEPTLRLQPFALPAGTRTFQFLTGWVLRLLKLGGWEASGADTSEIRSRIEDLYAFEPERRMT